MDIDEKLTRYDPKVLDRIGEHDGYWIQTLEEFERPGQPLDLSNPETPLALARHIIMRHCDSPHDDAHCDDACAESLANLSLHLLRRLEESDR